MPRDIFLIVSSNGKKPAHWSMFVPVGNAETKGKAIHVTGNTAQGFFLQFKRSYDYSDTTDVYQVLPLGQAEDAKVQDVVTQKESSDTIARDHLERAALDVPPPAKASNPFSTDGPNCQNWMKDYVQQLVAPGLLSESALEVVSQAPRVV